MTPKNDSVYFLQVFSPNTINGLNYNFINSLELYSEIIVEKPKIDYYFLKYICENLDFIEKLKNYSDISISNIYQGIKQIL